MKHFWSTACACTLCLALLLSPISAAEDTLFADVPTDEWYSEAVAYVIGQNIMNGTDEETFSPNASVNRAMIATVLWRLAGQPEIPFTGTIYPDVPEGRWYSLAVEWAYPQIMDGYPIPYSPEDSPTGFFVTFRPEQTLTREQLATVLYRYAKLQGMEACSEDSLQAYPDREAVSTWAAEAMQWCVANGLIRGTVENGITLLAPQGSATRAQLASILMRFSEKVLTDAK